MKKKILTALRKHMKAQNHIRDYGDGPRSLFNNGWGATQQETMELAIKIIKKIK